MSYVTTNVKMFLSALMVLSLPGFTVAGGFDQERMPSDIAGKMLYRMGRLERSHDEESLMARHQGMDASIQNVTREIPLPGAPFVASQRLGKIILIHDIDGFHVIQNGALHHINPCLIDRELQNISNEQLKAFFHANGYINLNQMDDGEFSLKANGRLMGGWPVTSGVAYGLTKGVLYGGYFVAAFFQPEILIDAPHVMVLIEAAAQTAAAVGMVAPLP